MKFEIARPRLGLYSRFFLLFSITTLLLAAFIALGVFTYSEREAKAIVAERHDHIYEMAADFLGEEINLDKIKHQVQGPKVELKIVRADQEWTTWEEFPELPLIFASAEKIESLYFARYQSKYYLLAQKEDTWIAATAHIVNLLVYPTWIAFWPWLVVAFILALSYAVLRRWLKPISDSLESAKRVSKGDFSFRIQQHPKTELADLTQGLNNMTADLKQMFEAKNELLLAISHELRTPLARMRVSLAMMEDNEVSADLNKDLVYMDDLIAQLLEGERLQQGHSVLHLSSYYLPSLIDDVVSEFNADSRVHVSNEIPELAIRIDVGRIKFLLRNLIGNAIAYSPENTPVNLAVENAHHDVVVNVSDSGVGIPADTLERIFDPFYSRENIENRSTKGVGLGLYLCRNIAIAHKGTLTVASEKGKGSRFTLTLPTDKLSA